METILRDNQVKRIKLYKELTFNWSSDDKKELSTLLNLKEEDVSEHDFIVLTLLIERLSLEESRDVLYLSRRILDILIIEDYCIDEKYISYNLTYLIKLLSLDIHNDLQRFTLVKDYYRISQTMRESYARETTPLADVYTIQEYIEDSVNKSSMLLLLLSIPNLNSSSTRCTIELVALVSQTLDDIRDLRTDITKECPSGLIRLYMAQERYSSIGTYIREFFLPEILSYVKNRFDSLDFYQVEDSLIKQLMSKLSDVLRRVAPL